MTIQFTAALISFVGIAGLIGVFLFVLSGSGQEAPYPEVQPRAYRIRKRLFYVLLIGFFLVPAFTLRSTPYAASADDPDSIIVDVTAHQWYWTLSQTAVPANRPIVFRVGSEDVNHGFGIYNEDNRLIAQVQAMPGYISPLAVQFDSPGTYKIMCLEYCGFVHHIMVSEIKVVAATTGLEEI